MREDHSSSEENDSGSAPAPPPEKDDGLVFRWRARREHAFALAFFVGVALLVHAAGFYLFQVTPSITGRVEAEPARVTLLDPSDPTTAAILREIDDRLIFLQPASLGSPSRMRIEDYAVTFQPSFMQRRVPFRGPAAFDPAAEPLRELLPAWGLVMPPVDPPAKFVSDEAELEADETARWVIGGTLGERALAESAEETLEAALPALESGPGLRVQIWADASGRIVNVLPLSGAEQPLAGEILSALRNHLRFVPKPGAALEEGELSVER